MKRIWHFLKEGFVNKDLCQGDSLKTLSTVLIIQGLTCCFKGIHDNGRNVFVFQNKGVIDQVEDFS